MKKEYSVTDLCAAFEVRQSGYYKAVQRQHEPGPRKMRDMQLRAKIAVIYEQSGRTYGVPRVHASLKKQNQ